MANGIATITKHNNNYKIKMYVIPLSEVAAVVIRTGGGGYGKRDKRDRCGCGGGGARAHGRQRTGRRQLVVMQYYSDILMHNTRIKYYLLFKRSATTTSYDCRRRTCRVRALLHRRIISRTHTHTHDTR